MILIPIETKNHAEDMLLVILDKSNIERIQRADPAEIHIRDIVGKTLVNPTVMICCEEPTPATMKIMNSGDIVGIIHHLSRGFEFRPDKGDNDDGPRRLFELN